MNDEWQTPEKYTESARLVMGSIDFDPASSEDANQRVKASRFSSDSLNIEWNGKIWLNPPYSRGKCAAMSEKLIEQITLGNVSEAIVLVNNQTDSKWFHLLLQRCDKICIVKGRIAFIGPEGRPVKGTRQGQVFFYFGRNYRGFYDEFSKYGVVLNA